MKREEEVSMATDPRFAPPRSGTYLSAHAAPRILLAEDDDDMRELLAEELHRDGYDILEARDGNEMELRLRSVRHFSSLLRFNGFVRARPA
jgi:PleD family two-component response regulator